MAGGAAVSSKKKNAINDLAKRMYELDSVQDESCIARYRAEITALLYDLIDLNAAAPDDFVFVPIFYVYVKKGYAKRIGDLETFCSLESKVTGKITTRPSVNNEVFLEAIHGDEGRKASVFEKYDSTLGNSFLSYFCEVLASRQKDWLKKQKKIAEATDGSINAQYRANGDEGGDSERYTMMQDSSLSLEVDCAQCGINESSDEWLRFSCIVAICDYLDLGLQRIRASSGKKKTFLTSCLRCYTADVFSLARVDERQGIAEFIDVTTRGLFCDRFESKNSKPYREDFFERLDLALMSGWVVAKNLGSPLLRNTNLLFFDEVASSFVAEDFSEAKRHDLLGIKGASYEGYYKPYLKLRNELQKAWIFGGSFRGSTKMEEAVDLTIDYVNELKSK